MKDVSFNATSQASFGYDGNGARTSKTTSSGTTSYVNDTRSLTSVLQETKGTNTLSYVPGLGQYDPSQTGNAQWNYYHGDAQNNRVLSDNGASVSHRWEYEPFGAVRSQSGTASSDFGYAGEQKDGETGLLNLRARYYDPALGRFVSRDVLSGTTGYPQSYNRFSYALNNPIRYVDPSGYCEQGQATGSDPDCQIDYEDEYHAPPRSDDTSGVTQAQERGSDDQISQQQQDNATLGLLADQLGLTDVQLASMLAAGRPGIVELALAAYALIEHIPGSLELRNRTMGAISAALGNPRNIELWSKAWGWVRQMQRAAQLANEGVLEAVEQRYGNRVVDFVTKVDAGDPTSPVLVTRLTEFKDWSQFTLAKNVGRLADQVRDVLAAAQEGEQVMIEFNLKQRNPIIWTAEQIMTALERRGVDIQRVEVQFVDQSGLYRP